MPTKIWSRIAAIFIIIVGIAGLALPVIPGTVLIGIGVIMLIKGKLEI